MGTLAYNLAHEGRQVCCFALRKYREPIYAVLYPRNDRFNGLFVSATHCSVCCSLAPKGCGAKRLAGTSSQSQSNWYAANSINNDGDNRRKLTIDGEVETHSTQGCFGINGTAWGIYRFQIEDSHYEVRTQLIQKRKFVVLTTTSQREHRESERGSRTVGVESGDGAKNRRECVA